MERNIPRRRCSIALAATAAALLLSATPAFADSVAYVKDGDVWLSTTDGARQYQVTSDGGYSTVSQADSGRLVALRGTHIRHLERDGRVIADITTPVSNSDPNMEFRGPFEPEVSPDGKKVSYTYFWQYKGYDPYCNITNDCTVKRLYHGTAFTDPNRLTAWDEPGFKRQSGWIYGSWVDNDNVLLSYPSMPLNEDTVLVSPSIGAPAFRRWFADPDYNGMVRDAVISRDKSAMAFTHVASTRMSILRSEGLFFPNYPVRCWNVTEPNGGKFHSPTINASGTKVFWAEGDGVHSMPLPKLGATSCGALIEQPKLLLAGASNPSWGPADVPPARPGAGGGVGGGGGRQGGGVKPPRQLDTPVERAETRMAAKAARLKTALKKGLVIRLTGATPGRHTVTAKLGRAKVARGKAAVPAGGRATVKLRFTAAGKRKLAGRRKASLTVTGAGARLKVTLKR